MLYKFKILIYLSGALQFGCAKTEKKNEQIAENIQSFAKLYGYVRWFHPSDEAQLIDWDNFAIYGVKKVENAPDAKALKDRLLELFIPIAPTLKIYLNNEKEKFNISEITPPDTSGYKLITWQHLGVELNSTFYSGYESQRINRAIPRSENKMPQVYYQYEAKNIHIKNIRLKLIIKGFDDDSVSLFILPMYKYDLQNLPKKMKPVFFKCNGDWKEYEINTHVRNDELLLFGVVYNGEKAVSFDNFKIEIKDEDQQTWRKIDIDNMDLNIVINNEPEGFYCNSDANYKVESKFIKDKDYCLEIKKNKDSLLFKDYPAIGEIIDKKISGSLWINLPIALYGDKKQTFPALDKQKLKELQQKLKRNEPILYERLGALIITWNVFQHFYPYFKEVKVDWEKQFEIAIEDTYNDESNYDFLKTLQRFTAKLKDGHISIVYPSNEWYCLPIAWEWIENKLVITKVFDNQSGLEVGDIVNKVNNISTEEYKKNVQQYFSAATPDFLNYRSQRPILSEENSECSLSVTGISGNNRELRLKHSILLDDIYQKNTNKTKYRFLEKQIIYLNLDQISMSKIDSLMPEILESKGLICDLRGYPADNIKPFLSYLLKEKDTAKWMCIPQIIYPDHEKMMFKEWEGWGLKPKDPHINVPVVFITDGRAISYAESIMGIVKHYKLATIIGQPTAGTNGNVNTFTVPGNYKIWFTGMKVTKLDGSQHQGIGVLPDIYVEKTIKGVIEGRDEFFEKAIETIKNKL